MSLTWMMIVGTGAIFSTKVFVGIGGGSYPGCHAQKASGPPGGGPDVL